MNTDEKLFALMGLADEQAKVNQADRKSVV